MKTNPLNIVLLIAVAVLGVWGARMNTALNETRETLTALHIKMAAVIQNVSQLKTQEAKIVIQHSNATAITADKNPAENNHAGADPRALLVAAEAKPPGMERNSALYSALMQTAVKDPQGAWDYAQNLPDDGTDLRLNTLKGILKTWATQDPAQAAAKLATLSLVEKSASQDNVSAVIAERWLKQDPEAASKWVDTLPPGNARDSAVMAVVETASQNDLPTAFNWTTTMSDPAKRGSLITGIVRQWARTDPEAATQAVLKQYPNNNNGRQATLLGLIKQVSAEASAAAGGAAP